MNQVPIIEPYDGDFEDVLELLRMSMGMVAPEGARQLLAIEAARGTQYFTASSGGESVGIIGLWCDATGAISVLEPAQVIDFAVAPTHRRQGVGRALMEQAARMAANSGQRWLWLYTGLTDEKRAVYTAMGFKLVAMIPDWFGEGVHRAVYRRALGDD